MELPYCFRLWIAIDRQIHSSNALSVPFSDGFMNEIQRRQTTKGTWMALAKPHHHNCSSLRWLKMPPLLPPPRLPPTFSFWTSRVLTEENVVRIKTLSVSLLCLRWPHLRFLLSTCGKAKMGGYQGANIGLAQDSV